MLDKICIFDHTFEAGLTEHSGISLEALPVYLGGATADTQCHLPEVISLGARDSVRSLKKAINF